MKDDLQIIGSTPARTHYCGPTAISVVTGVPVTYVEHIIASHRNQNPDRSRKVTERGVKGVYLSELNDVLRELGWKATAHQGWGKTFGQWLKSRSGDDRRATWIICTAHHYLVVRGAEVYCSNQGHTSEARTRYKRSRPVALWRVEKRT